MLFHCAENYILYLLKRKDYQWILSATITSSALTLMQRTPIADVYVSSKSLVCIFILSTSSIHTFARYSHNFLHTALESIKTFK